MELGGRTRLGRRNSWSLECFGDYGEIWARGALGVRVSRAQRRAKGGEVGKSASATGGKAGRNGDYADETGTTQRKRWKNHCCHWSPVLL